MGVQHVFIIGSKGIPAHYGGFETFVEKLTEHQVSPNIKYHVACAVDELSNVIDYDHNGAHCHCFKWRPIGPARAIVYDLEALDWAIAYAREHALASPIFYVLACRIGPFITKRAKAIHEIGGALFVNPDGHEYKRSKWSAPVRKYWKASERGMVKGADLLVCDSETIEACIHEEYADIAPATVYISYGAEIAAPSLIKTCSAFEDWLLDYRLNPCGYYLVVGRFVPENNYETIIREFMASNTMRSLVLITSDNAKLMKELRLSTGFDSDDRVKFVGSVYDPELLRAIREHAFAYIHGHEVGGTNPSLLEALASTRLNLVFDVGFNREVADEAALYWDKRPGSLSEIIKYSESLLEEDIQQFGTLSTSRIASWYSWEYITQLYESLFSFNANDDPESHPGANRTIACGSFT